MDPGTQSYVVVLQEKDGSRLLPIWIGQAEAESIVRHMHNMQGERPIAHDLCKTDHRRDSEDATLRRIQDHSHRPEEHSDLLRRAAPGAQNDHRHPYRLAAVRRDRDRAPPQRADHPFAGRGVARRRRR